MSESLKEYLEELVNAEIITGRHAEVLCYLHGLHCAKAHSIEDTACRFGITPERVRQVSRRALQHLGRSPYRCRSKWKDYPD